MVLNQTTTSSKTLTQVLRPGAISGTVTGSETSNLLTAASASFEDGTMGAWAAITKCTFANSTEQAWHGTHSGRMVTSADGLAIAGGNVTAQVAFGSTYTASARLKGTAGKNYHIQLADNIGCNNSTVITATGDWQTVSVTRTLNAGATVSLLYLMADTSVAGDVVYWDAIQLEAGATATPSASTASSVTVYNASDQQVGTATTAGGGTYTIGNLPSGSYRVHFGGDSTHLAGDNTGVAVVLNQTTTSSKTLTQAFGAISGTVRGSESGTPVLANVEVKVYNGSDVQVGSTATTDSGGLYSIGTIPSGTYRVHFGGDSTHPAADNTGVNVINRSTTTSNKTLTQAYGAISGTVTGSETSNLLTAASASFEDGTMGAWAAITKCTFANSTEQAWHGTHSGRMVTSADGLAIAGGNVTAQVAFGSTYTASARLKGTAGKNYHIQLADNIGCNNSTVITATGDWQTVSVTRTLNAGATVSLLYLMADTSVAGDVVYWDAIQLEAGATATPFGLDGISVTVYNASDQQVGTATTAGGGTYTIGDLPSGSYRVHFGGDSTHLAGDNTGVAVVLNQTTTSSKTLTQAP